MCKSNYKRAAVARLPYFHAEETHNADYAGAFHAQEMSRCTYAGNGGEKLIAEETPTSHNDPVYSDFEVTERSRRVW